MRATGRSEHNREGRKEGNEGRGKGRRDEEERGGLNEFKGKKGRYGRFACLASSDGFWYIFSISVKLLVDVWEVCVSTPLPAFVTYRNTLPCKCPQRHVCVSLQKHRSSLTGMSRL